MYNCHEIVQAFKRDRRYHSVRHFDFLFLLMEINVLENLTSFVQERVIIQALFVLGCRALGLINSNMAGLTAAGLIGRRSRHPLEFLHDKRTHPTRRQF